MFGGIGMQEIVIILIVGLLVFGATKLPKIARSLGQGIKEFKKTVKDLDDDDDGNTMKYVDRGPRYSQPQQYNQYQGQQYAQYQQPGPQGPTGPIGQNGPIGPSSPQGAYAPQGAPVPPGQQQTQWTAAPEGGTSQAAEHGGEEKKSS
jgi:sec-independent protein translocase protein TatA